MADFNIKCPRCGGMMAVQDEWADMEITCPFCRGIFLVPRRNPARNRYAPPYGAAFPGASYSSGGKPNGKAVASMILGAAGLLTGALGLIPGFYAIVFSERAAVEMERTGNHDGCRYARAGMILGFAGIVMGCIWIIALSIGAIRVMDWFGKTDPSSLSVVPNGNNTDLNSSATECRTPEHSLPEQRAAMQYFAGSLNHEANAVDYFSSGNQEERADDPRKAESE